MKRNIHTTTLEDDLQLLKQKGSINPLSIKEIQQILSIRWQSFLLLLLSLPFCQPLQIPGLSTPFGLVIAFIGLKMAFGKYAWLPKRILAVTISPHILQKITDKLLWLSKKMKRWVHPRMTWLCDAAPLQVFNGLLVFTLGILLALPLPIPFSNLMAAWALFFIGLGLLEDDGLFILLGYLTSLLTIAFFVATVLLIKLTF